MVSKAFEVISPGLQTTIQDWPGRIGYWRVGIPPSGPMDELSFRRANLLVENQPSLPALEVQFLGPKLRALQTLDIAISGGVSRPTIDERPVQTNETLTIARGQVLDIGSLMQGARCYLAIAGGFAKEKVLGSAATFPRGGIGGGPLTAGGMLEAEAPAAGGSRLRLRHDQPIALAEPVTIEVTAGPHLDWLSFEGAEAVAGAPWKVSPQSDRTGIRLIGPKIGFSYRALSKAPENGSEPTNVINTGYPVGGINICGDTPIILSVDGPSQGGFITPFVVASGAMWKVGQLRPHQHLIFQRLTLDQAIELRVELERLASPACMERL
jgi:5-oxoprolinase (ATP-hydrolysing) subunit C